MRELVRVRYGNVGEVEGTPYVELFLNEEKYFLTITEKCDNLIIVKNLTTQAIVGMSGGFDIIALNNIDKVSRVTVFKSLIVNTVIHMLLYKGKDISLDWEIEGAESKTLADFIWNLYKYTRAKSPVLHFGTFAIHPKYNIPSIEVLYGTEVVGHLTPFRGYHFQISQSYDGEMCLGESYSECSMLRDKYRNYSIADRKAIYMTMICSCVISYLSNNYGFGKNVGNILYGPTYRTEGREIDKFIEATIEWLDRRFPIE